MYHCGPGRTRGDQIRAAEMEWIKANLGSAKIKELRGHKGTVNCLDWSCDGRRLASGSSDHTVRLWTLTSDRDSSCQELKCHSASVEQLAWSPSDPEVLATVSADKTVALWRQGQLIRQVSLCASPINLAWDWQGTRLIVGTKDDNLILMETNTMGVLWSKKMPYEINQMTWINSDNQILLSTGLGTILLIDSQDGSELASHLAHTSSCHCLKRNGTGNLAVVGAADALISVWSLDDFACTRVIGRLDWPIRAMDLTKDDILAAGSEDPHIELASILTGEHIGRIPVAGPVSALSWHPKRYILAAATVETDQRTNRPEPALRIHFIERLSSK